MLVFTVCPSTSSGLESTSSVKPQQQKDSLYPKLSSSTHMKSRPQWEFSKVVTEMLEFYAEQVCTHYTLKCGSSCIMQVFVGTFHSSVFFQVCSVQ